jgi:hypothetical protein
MLVMNGRIIRANVEGDPKYGSKLIAAYHGATCKDGDESDAVCLAMYGPTALARMEQDAAAKVAARRVKAKASAAKRRASK